MEELCSILLSNKRNSIQNSIQFTQIQTWVTFLSLPMRTDPNNRSSGFSALCWEVDRLWSSRYNCTFTTEYKQQCIRPGKQNTMAGNNVLHQENKTWRSRYIFLSTIMRWEDKEGKRGRRWVTHWNKQAGRRRWVCSWSLTRPSCCCNPGRR